MDTYTGMAQTAFIQRQEKRQEKSLCFIRSRFFATITAFLVKIPVIFYFITKLTIKTREILGKVYL